MLLALLLTPEIQLSDTRRMMCLKELLLNSSRDHISLVTKALISELTEHTACAVSLRRDDDLLLPRVRTTLGLLRSCLVSLSTHSRRWGTMAPHIPAILAHLSALVSHLLLPR
eukprot:CAMPEP_0173070780 /NCGR_PEP_ID=MMETSP1102-20130122/8829_1 /TAXON_ID=49646 /ORGANISM="Geminigera sp., Strain Caron Lab Isolate" /LENGTH=112 /DNA_ID=CAMNT_0013939131 /DNA_START=104 /DNA_END=438 /DNA_ORIENTATION=+